ncbi:MAG: sigma-70 family RNA polymerase sigma factor [bacterium]|nr:sigma-70 family RNA polymerase sigma factor [bacterium]
MGDKRLTRLFLRYRSRGDVDALTSVFDATAPGLLSLALHLVEPKGDAEDIVQATFLAAIEKADTFDPAFPLRPWLVGILVRKARQVNERTARPIESERLGERDPADPVQGAIGSELTDELKRALARLPERYQLVLDPFLHDGDRPQDIARRRGLAPGTVRVQIHRGLELLRKTLPTGYAVGALAATATSPAFERMRANVTAAARATPRAASAGSAATLPWLGSRSLAAAALVLAGGTVGVWRAGWFASTGTPELEAQGALEQTPPASRATRAALASSPTEKSAERTQRAGVEGTAAVEPWTLVLNVSGLDAPAPSDLQLEVTQTGSSAPPLAVPLTRDGSSTVVLDDAPRGASAPTLTLRVDRGAYAAIDYTTTASDVRPGRRIAVDLALTRIARIFAGRVVAESDARPTVAFYPSATDESGAPSVGSPSRAACDDDGAFLLVADASAGWFVAVAANCAPHGQRVDSTDPMDVDCGAIALDGGAAIEGVAYAPGRELAAPGTVVVSSAAARDAPQASLDGSRLGFLANGVTSAAARSATGAGGTFHVGGLTPGPYDVLFVPETRASGFYDEHEHAIRVAAPTSGLELESPIRVYTLRVVCEGRPVADAMVLFELSGGGSVSGPTQPDGTYPFFMAQSDERYHVEVRKPGFAPLTDLRIGPKDYDRDFSLELELARTDPPSRLVLALAPGGGPVGPLTLRMHLADSSWYVYRGITSGEATIDLGEVPAGSYRLELKPQLDARSEPSRQSFWRTTELELTCRPSAAERIDVPLRPGGRAVFRVAGRSAANPGRWHLSGPDAQGSLALMTWDAARTTVEVIYTSSEIERDGTYWLRRPLAPGDYRLGIRDENEQVLELPFVITAGDLTDVHVDLGR